MLLRDITSLDVKKALLGTASAPGVWLTHPPTAKKIRGRVERILDAARVAGHRAGPNPAIWKGQLSHALPPLSTANEKHHAALPVEDVPSLAVELARRDNLSAKALLFTMLCACRTGDTIGATWAEIDLDAKVWSIPKGRTKAGRPFRIPLADHTATMLKALPRNGECVFAKSNGRPLSNMAMLQLMRGIRGMGATVHGLRSSFKDFSTDRGFADDVSEAALDHLGSDKVRAAYARSDLFNQRRTLMDAWAAHALGQDPAAKLAAAVAHLVKVSKENRVNR
jgi:integrase